MMRPLDGVTVVALEQVIAGPFATRQLAELGARVIKIERPGTGDAARGYDRSVKGLSSHFVWVNRSKESLALDLKHPRAPEVLARLVARADVFLQNLAPGAAERVFGSFHTSSDECSACVAVIFTLFGPKGSIVPPLPKRGASFAGRMPSVSTVLPRPAVPYIGTLCIFARSGASAK